jgi:hypothetical protein
VALFPQSFLDILSDKKCHLQNIDALVSESGLNPVASVEEIGLRLGGTVECSDEAIVAPKRSL